MPRVPIYEQQVSEVTPDAQVPKFHKPTDIGQAMSIQSQAVREYGDTVNKVANLLTQRLIERKDMEVQSNIALHDTAFRVEMQNMLYNQDVDENDIPKGFLQRQLDQTDGSTEEFDNSYNQLKQKYIDSVDSDYQKEILGKYMDEHFTQTRGMVMRHQADETNKGYNVALDTDLKMITAQATAITDPLILSKTIERAKTISSDRDKYNGLDEDSIKLNQYKAASEITKSAINGIVDQNVEVAKKLFNSSKPQLLPSDQKDLQNVIDGKSLSQRSQVIWSQVQPLRLSDGMPDLPKMEEAIDNIPGIKPEDRDHLKTYVRSKASEDRTNINIQDKANENDFMNQAIASRQSGRPLDETIKLVGAFGKDNYDRLQKEEAIRKLYAPRTTSDPTTFMALWEGVQGNSIKKEDIDTAFNKDSINVSDWRTLREDWYRRQIEGVDQASKLAMDRVRLIAEEKYGSDKLKKDQFLYEVSQFSKGKTTVDDIIGVANNLAASDKSSGILGMFQKSNFSTAFKKQDEQRASRNAPSDANNAAWDKAKLDLGDDVVSAIGKATLVGGKSTWGLTDIDGYAQALGGYDSIKFGTPTNNVINALIKRGDLATVPNVKAVLKKYPNYGVKP